MPLAEQTSLSAALCGRCCWVVGCGLLGSALLTTARAAGMQALGIDPASSAADLRGNAAEPALLASARSQLEPDIIFCCAATHGGDEAAYRATYLELPQALHAASPGVPLIFCSSSSVYGGQDGEEVNESTPCCASSARAQLLREAEESVLAMGGTVARLVPMYGKGRCELLRRFVQREPELPGEDSRWLNYIHADDAARALLCLAGRQLSATGPCIVNVCAESFTKGAVYEFLARLTGLPRVTSAADSGCRGTSNRRVSASLLRAWGWEPVTPFPDWAARHWQSMN